MVGSGRFSILDKFKFMNQDNAGGKEQQTASGAKNGNSQQAGSDMPVPLRQKKTYKVKSGNPQDAGAQPAPAAAAGTAAAGKPLYSDKLGGMSFMQRHHQAKRKREEDDSQAAASEDEAKPVLVAAAASGALAAAGAAPPFPGNPTSSSSAAAKRALVVMQAKDPSPMGCFGRLSFGGFNPVVESLQSVGKGDEPSTSKAAAAGGQQPEDGVDVGHRDMAAALGSRGEGRHHHQHQHHQHHRHQQQEEGWISGKNAFRSGVKKHKR